MKKLLTFLFCSFLLLSIGALAAGCDGHTHAYTPEVFSATCTEQGYTLYTCSCGDSYTSDVVPSLGHDTVDHDGYTQKLCTELGWYDYQTCNRCSYTTYQEIAPTGHDIEHRAEQAATCTADGWKAYEFCKNCSYTTFSSIPSPGHDLVNHDGKEPTCTEEGWDAYQTCNNCTLNTKNTTPALEHLTQQHPYCAPTCTSKGNEAYEACLRQGCGYSTYVELPEAPHDLEYYEEKEATCTETGYKAYEDCKNPDCPYTTFEPTPYKHQLTYHDAVEPTCETSGYYAYEECSLCTHTTFTPIPNLEHDIHSYDAKAATCTTVGWHAYEKCIRNGCSHSTYSEIKELGHSYTPSITQPSCTEQGYTTHTCDNCGDSFNDTFVAAKGHQPSGSVLFNTTSHSYICTCGEEVSSAHSFVNKLCSCGARQSITYLTFAAIDGGYAVSGCQDVEAEIIIPTYYMGQPVLEIGRAAFKDHTKITAVKFEQNSLVKVFNELAFKDCTAVVEIPSKIEQLCEDAYEYNYQLNNGIRTEYKGGSYLGNAYNPYVFLLGGYESEVVVHAQTRIIDSYAFHTYDTTRLTKITFESNENLVRIGVAAFFSSNLKEIVIPSSVKFIGERAFAENLELETVNFSSASTSLKTLPYRAFADCDKLSVVNIANGVTDIGNEVFESCEKLALVNIPASVINMGNNVFRFCTSDILNICCMADDTNWATSWASPVSAFYDCIGVFIDGSIYLIAEGKATLAKWGGANDVVIPENVSYAGVDYKVVAIKEGLFTNNTSITSVSIPSGIKEIGTYTFSCCSNLKTIIFAENSELETIKYGAFDYTAIEVLHLPNGLTTIEAYAFNSCTLLKEIYIPLSVSYIGSSAFEHYGEQVVSVFCEAPSKPDGWQTLKFGYHSVVLWNCVGSATIDDITYSLHSDNTAQVIKYNGTAELLAIPQTITYNEQTYSVTGITDKAFSEGINYLIIPASVVKIEEQAFAYAYDLYRIYFCGTIEQWNNPDNLSFWDAYIYSENTPEESGYFWHYDTDGKTPIIY